MRRPAKKALKSHRSLSREQELALVICDATYHSGCACAQSRTGPCSKMVWAAGRAMKFLGVPGHTEDRQT